MKPCNHPCCPNDGPCRKPKQKKKRKPIRQYSKKRSKENRKYTALRKQFLSDHPTCEFPGCEREATDVHHERGRGKYFLDQSTWKALCREHHNHVETHPMEAKLLGLSNS